MVLNLFGSNALVDEPATCSRSRAFAKHRGFADGQAKVEDIATNPKLPREEKNPSTTTLTLF